MSLFLYHYILITIFAMNKKPTKKQFEEECKKILLGNTIRGIEYGELKCNYDESGNVIEPEPMYFTMYPEVDTLDYSLYIRTDNGFIMITWDNTFVSYGLTMSVLQNNDTITDYEQKWDVTNDEKWGYLIGDCINDFKIQWYGKCPQTFLITTQKPHQIIISASSLDQNTNEVSVLDNNLLVSTNLKLAEDIGLITKHVEKPWYKRLFV